MPSTNGHGPRRAILYARVSTDEQARSGYSLAQQLEALREYATREGYEILEEIQDPGQSGASLERPGIDRVRDLVAAGSVSVVLAQDRDRFAREPAYHYLLKREFEVHGTKIRALNDRGDESPEGELTDGILDQLAKYERAKIVERSRRGKPTASATSTTVARDAHRTALRLVPKRSTMLRKRSKAAFGIWCVVSSPSPKSYATTLSASSKRSGKACAGIPTGKPIRGWRSSPR
jgi:predicted site-specific integrase-resolvase